MKDANSGEKDRRSALNKAILVAYVLDAGCWTWLFENEESACETAFSLKSFLLRGLRGLRGLALIRLGSSVSSPDSLMRGLLPLRQIFSGFLHQSRVNHQSVVIASFPLSCFFLKRANSYTSVTRIINNLTRPSLFKQRRQSLIAGMPRASRVK
jgi:hypothetical protein